MKNCIKYTFTLFLSALFFASCASSPKKEPPAEVPQETLPTEPGAIQEPPVYETTDTTTTEPEQQETEPALEPVEGIDGFFITEPLPQDQSGETEQSQEPLPETEPIETEILTPEEDITSESGIPQPEQSLENTSGEVQPQQETQAEQPSSVPETPEEQQVPGKTEIQTEQTTEETNATEQQQSQTQETDSQPEQTPEEETESAAEEIIPVPSRSMTMTSGQYLDISYPGSGWLYLGEEDGKQLFRYFGRKIGTTDTSFTLRSRNEGTTLLHFSKTDTLTGDIIDDWLEVTVKGKNATQKHAQAPSYAQAVPPRPARKSNTVQEETASETQQAVSQTTPSREDKNTSKNTAGTVQNTTAPKKTIPEPDTTVQPQQNLSSQKGDSGTTIIQTSESAPEEDISVETVPSEVMESTFSEIEEDSPLTAEEYLSLAKNSFDSKDYVQTLRYLDSFFEKATSKIDEGLFLKGQVLETNSQVRDIKNALAAYETIVREYPQSTDWNSARERITYLKKFYFNIR